MTSVKFILATAIIATCVSVIALLGLLRIDIDSVSNQFAFVWSGSTLVAAASWVWWLVLLAKCKRMKRVSGQS